MLAEMEDNPKNSDIQSSCLSILREHCINLDEEDIRQGATAMDTGYGLHNKRYKMFWNKGKASR